MSKSAIHGLPDALVASLARLGRACGDGSVPLDLLAETMEALDRLPPEAASSADGRIASAAGLYQGDENRTSFPGSSRRSVSARALLARNPELAHLFTFHRDGYVREAALHCFADGIHSGFMVAALALRLNDWVKPVRVAARRCFERTLPLTSASVVVDAAPFLLTRWRSWRRWEPENAAAVDRVFERPDVAAALAERFVTGTVGPLGTMFRYALRSPALDGDLLRLAQKAKLPAVRSVALRTLIERRATWPVGFGREWVDKVYGITRRITLYEGRPVCSDAVPDVLIRAGLRDRFSAVRRVAADGLIERRASFPEIEGEIALLANDRSAKLRERAAFLARDRAKGNPPKAGS